MSDYRPQFLAIARVAYEAVRAYCATAGEHHMREWDVAPPWVHDDWHDRVSDAIQPGATPGLVHSRWRARAEAAGWKRGDIHAPDRLEHPALVDYPELAHNARVEWEVTLVVARTLAGEMLPGVLDAPAKAPIIDSARVSQADSAEQSVAQLEPGDNEDKGKRHKGRKG